MRIHLLLKGPNAYFTNHQCLILTLIELQGDCSSTVKLFTGLFLYACSFMRFGLDSVILGICLCFFPVAFRRICMSILYLNVIQLGGSIQRGRDMKVDQSSMLMDSGK